MIYSLLGIFIYNIPIFILFLLLSYLKEKTRVLPCNELVNSFYSNVKTFERNLES